MAWIADIQVGRVGVHGLHLLPHRILVVGEIDAVAKALAHLLLAIRARQTACRLVLGQHDLWLGKDGGIDLVEATDQLACHLKHRLLVLASRHDSGLESHDIGSLRHGVAEEAKGNIGLEIAHLDLSLHRRVALHARDADKIHQIGSQLRQFGDAALDIERTLLRIETSREVVQCDLDDVLTNLLWVVGIVCQSLHVGHEDEHTVIIARILKFHATTQTTDIVSQMELASGAVARQNNLSHSIFVLFEFEVLAAVIRFEDAKIRLLFGERAKSPYFCTKNNTKTWREIYFGLRFAPMA